jgi:hypothetical protein
MPRLSFRGTFILALGAGMGSSARITCAGAIGSADAENRIERYVKIPEEAYQRIESAIAGGHIEGEIYLKNGSRFRWFLDR